MRTGTLWCFLFGHKWIWVQSTSEILPNNIWPVHHRECIRCGKDRE